MALSSLSRFLPLSTITTKTLKIPTLPFTTSSLAEKLYTHFKNNPNQPKKSLTFINAKLDPTCVHEVLKRLSLYDTQMGLRFFIWASHQPNYRHSTYMYSRASDLFGIRQNPNVVLDLVEAFRAERCVVDVKLFKVVLNLCKEGSLANVALLVLRKMSEFGVCPDTNAYNVVVRLFCNVGDVDTAFKLMGEMGFVGLFPDMVTYVSLIKGFCDVGRLDDASRLFEAMKVHGCTPNVVAYSTLLDGVIRFGSVERALELLGEMENEGGDCSPNVVSYTSAIQSFCEKGRTIDGLKILDRMEARGCAPNRVTVSSLVKGFCMECHLEDAYNLINRVGAEGSVSYGDCYSSLVLCLVRLKKVEEAEKVFRKVLSCGVKLDGLACSVMIRQLCLEDRVLDAFRFYDEIEKNGWLSTIDSDIYSVLLFGLCQKSHSMEAAKLARSMLVKGIHLKAPYIDRIVEHLKEFEDKELVAELVGIGKSCQLKPME